MVMVTRRSFFHAMFTAFLRFLLFLVKTLIVLGETVTQILNKAIHIVKLHIRAIYYIICHARVIVKKYVIKLCSFVGHRTWTFIEGGLIFLRRQTLHIVHFLIRFVFKLLILFQAFISIPKKTVRWILTITSHFVHFIHKLPKWKPLQKKLVVAKPYSHKLHPTKIKYMRLRIISVLIITTICGLLTWRGYIFYINLPRPLDIGRVNYHLTTHVYDRKGRLLFDFYKDQHRTPILLENLPPYISQATIAIEDKEFYHHKGVALFNGIARAFRETFIRNNGLQGGSTITQQLVKTALLSPERTISRKIKEIIIALETEQIFSKEQILEMYLNQVPYGGSTYGIEEASRKYFRKSAKDLTLSEAALLAGLPQAPTTYSPFTNFDLAIQRRNQVLRAMREQKFITQKQYQKALKEKVNVALDTIAIEAPHFVFYVQKYLEKYVDVDELYRAGFRVKTTLDLDIQKKAEVILEEELSSISNLNVTNGAILITKPTTGEILAMVGSVNYFDGQSGAFNVITGLRQPGSSIKPILYARAMEEGLTAASIIEDTPTVFQTGGTEVYRPVNYDGRFHGRITARYALANSYNIPAVKLMSKVGVSNFLSFAKFAGIDTWDNPDNYGLSLALGGGDVTMVDMAEAYSILAHEGVRTDLTPLIQISNNNGRVVKKDKPQRERVIDPSYAYIITDILADNQARVQAFGPGSALEIPGYKVSVKTGTTDEKRDNWTIGYTPDYMVLVWVGNNDHTPMNPYLTSGITGAAPIWNRIMTYLLNESNEGDNNWFSIPDNVVQKPCMGRDELFVQGTENSVPCALPKPTSSPSQKEKQSP